MLWSESLQDLIVLSVKFRMAHSNQDWTAMRLQSTTFITQGAFASLCLQVNFIVSTQNYAHCPAT